MNESDIKQPCKKGIDSIIKCQLAHDARSNANYEALTADRQLGFFPKVLFGT